MLRIGDTITLEPINTTESATYRCRLVERIDQHLFIDYPVHEKTGKTTFFMNGTKLKVTFVGQDNSIYSFNTEIIGRTKKVIPMVVLSYPGDEKLSRIQRRQFVRIDASVDVAVHSNSQRFQPFVTVTTDISAGGSSIILPRPMDFQPDEELTTWFVLPMLSGENHYLKIASKLIRVIGAKKGERERASLQFVYPNHNDQQIITRFGFERQLSLRKKGIGDVE